MVSRVVIRDGCVLGRLLGAQTDNHISNSRFSIGLSFTTNNFHGEFCGGSISNVVSQISLTIAEKTGHGSSPTSSVPPRQ